MALKTILCTKKYLTSHSLKIPIVIGKDCLSSFVKMATFWAEIGVAYLEINELPCLHEINIQKCINVYSIQIIENILKYKNGFKNNLMYKEIFN
jgi:hypothetical protein